MFRKLFQYMTLSEGMLVQYMQFGDKEAMYFFCIRHPQVKSIKNMIKNICG